jgi:hypothetical protein
VQTLVVLLYVGCLLAPLLAVGVRALLRIRRGFAERSEQHAAFMDGMAEGAGFDERDRREQLRRRLFLREG